MFSFRSAVRDLLEAVMYSGQTPVTCSELERERALRARNARGKDSLMLRHVRRRHAARNARRMISLRSPRDNDGSDVSIRSIAAATRLRTARVIGSRVSSRT
jgi:hypothetical protein